MECRDFDFEPCRYLRLCTHAQWFMGHAAMRPHSSRHKKLVSVNESHTDIMVSGRQEQIFARSNPPNHPRLEPHKGALLSLSACMRSGNSQLGACMWHRIPRDETSISFAFGIEF